MISMEDIKQLVKRGSNSVLSVYLQTDAALQENQAATPAWQIWLRSTLRDLENGLTEAEREHWGGIRQRLEQHIQDTPPTTKSLALFFGPDFEQVHELPVLVDANLAHFGEAAVVPLLWWIDEYEPYLIVLVDSEEAHFLKTYLGTVERERAMASDRFDYDFYERTIMPRSITPAGGQQGGSDAGVIQGGYQKDVFEHGVIAEMIERFYRDVAGQIGVMRQQIGAERVIIGGRDKAAHAVAGHLEEAVKKALVGVIELPFDETDEEVMKRIMPTALEYERRNEVEIVDQIINLARSGGRGALGMDDVLSTIDQQRVELLVLPWPLEGDEAMLRLMTVRTLQNNGQVELVFGEAAARLRDAGGVGARLYYAL